ncbi:(2Fe-2S)-binding protein, partial [Solemya velum gill symbiont]
MKMSFTLDGKSIPFKEGDTIMDAALNAGEYIPHLCHEPGFTPHGSCRLCLVSLDGRNISACTLPAVDGSVVESN